METKIIKVTDKGQISLPVNIRQSMNILQGDSLLLIRKNHSIIIKKIEQDDFSDLLKHSETTAAKLWSNKEDDIWDTI